MPKNAIQSAYSSNNKCVIGVKCVKYTGTICAYKNVFKHVLFCWTHVRITSHQIFWIETLLLLIVVRSNRKWSKKKRDTITTGDKSSATVAKNETGLMHRCRRSHTHGICNKFPIRPDSTRCSYIGIVLKNSQIYIWLNCRIKYSTVRK